MVDRDFVTCPACGERNIRGEDNCWNCMTGLAAIDVPETAQPISESAFTRSLNTLRLRRPTVLPANVPVTEAIAALRANPASAVILTDGGGEPVGIFTERDVLHRIAGKAGTLSQPVSAHMTKNPVTVEDGDMMAVVLNHMGEGGFRHLPVMARGEVEGMITAMDVARWIMLNYFEDQD